MKPADISMALILLFVAVAPPLSRNSGGPMAIPNLYALADQGRASRGSSIDEEGFSPAAEARQSAAIRRRREKRVDVLGYHQHLNAMYRISTVASAEPDISRFLAQLLDISLAVLGGESGCVMLTARGRNTERLLSIGVSKGLRLRPETPPVSFGEGVAGWVAQKSKPLRLVGSLDRYPQFKGLESDPAIAESLVVPIVFRKEVLGTISINASKPGTLGPELLTLLVGIAEVAGSTIHRDRVERAREQQDRLCVLGQLSASLAHELNNPLSFLRANLDALTELFPAQVAAVSLGAADVEDLRSLIRETQQGVEQMVSLVSNMKAAARNPTPKGQPTDLNALMLKAATMVRPQFRHRVTFTIEPGEVPLVIADPSRILQVLINLVVNAAQSVGKSGHVVLRCRADHGWAVADVQDDGTGIPAEVAARIFEPFFTTKTETDGTGLGLNISRQIAAEHGGELTFTTEQGKGTRFSLRLPGGDHA